MPYICHPMSVGLTLQAAGFDDDTIIAGLFHDLLEDTEVTAKNIEENFGTEVLRLVQSVSEDKSLPWEERKRLLLENILTARDERTKAIFAADKVHNISSLINYIKDGRQDFWSFFKKGKEVTVGHYLELAEALEKKWKHPLSEQLLALAGELKRLSR